VSRVRGLAEWTPRAKTLPLLENVREVLDQYAAQLPLTLRQVFYRLVAVFEFDKTEQAYDRLGETLNRARRAGLIAFAAIRDDGVTAMWPTRFASADEFWEMVEHEIEDTQLDRQEGQEQTLEVWVEAAGMVPLVFDAVSKYGVRAGVLLVGVRLADGEVQRRLPLPRPRRSHRRPSRRRLRPVRRRSVRGARRRDRNLRGPRR
jgi:hypothetical protein